MSFTYRVRTYMSPKKREAELKKQQQTGAVTPSTFKRKRKLTIPEDEEEISFRYRPKSGSADTSAYLESPTVKRGNDQSPAHTPNRRKSGVHDFDLNAESNSATASQATPTRTPKKQKTKHTLDIETLESIPTATNSEIVNNIESVLLQSVKSISTKFTGKDAFVAEHLNRVCSLFIQSTRLQQNTETFAPLKNSSTLLPRINALINLCHRFAKEERQWEEIKNNPLPPSTTQSTPQSTASKKSPKKQSSTETPLQKLMIDLSLQVDELKPIVKSAQNFVAVSERHCNAKIKELHKEGFKVYDTTDPKKLIRSLAYD